MLRWYHRDAGRMQPEATATAPRRRNRKPNPPRIAPDGRTRGARRHREITTELNQMVGGKPDAGQRLLIETASALTISIEALSRAQQRGEAIDANRLLKLSAQLNRTLAALRQSRKAKAVSAGLTLADYLARRSATKHAQMVTGEPNGDAA